MKTLAERFKRRKRHQSAADEIVQLTRERDDIIALCDQQHGALLRAKKSVVVSSHLGNTDQMDAVIAAHQQLAGVHDGE